MQIEILGCESFGARSLACVVYTDKRKTVIDPGVALARLRSGLSPHPKEVAAASRIRERVLFALEGATDIVISHYHGDHMPMKAEDPYQLPMEALPSLKGVSLWSKGPEKISSLSARRRKEFSEFLGFPLPASEGKNSDNIDFSSPVPHGTRDKGFGTVMMTRICEGDEFLSILRISSFLIGKQSLRYLTGSQQLFLPQVLLCIFHTASLEWRKKLLKTLCFWPKMWIR